ncbi:Blue copper protein [Rhynchospora pubera]|uniref:Blue copper protein n=1 Tax=Rhynchospora pubera TaxID=906938 RepID=A0AAV8HED2_9POAL|nr:Blue copper protein [Rhynchospora pubera]
MFNTKHNVQRNRRDFANPFCIAASAGKHLAPFNPSPTQQRRYDHLVFRYNNSIHDVREVTQYGYTWCSAAEPILADDSGFFVVELASNGTRYFICTISTHCLKGMKLQIDVLNSSSLSPPPPVSSPNKAAVTQIGFANFVLGMIGLMLMVL